MDPSNLNTKFEILFRDVLSALTANVRSPVLIVFDALNECGTPETRQSLMNILYNDLLTLLSNFLFLITARPEGDILLFMYLSTCGVRILNLDNRIGESRLDVKRYIESEWKKLKSSNALVILKIGTGIGQTISSRGRTIYMGINCYQIHFQEEN